MPARYKAQDMTATVAYLREAARCLEAAASALEAASGYHHEHAKAMIAGARQHMDRSERQIDRELAARAAAMREAR